MKPKKTFILEAKMLIRAKDSMEANKIGIGQMAMLHKRGYAFYQYSIKESE